MIKVAICGYGRAGKDTAAIQLAKHTPYRYVAGTSYWARHLVFEEMTRRGIVYANAEECWLDRHRDRPLWARIIGDYNRDDPVRLYRDCLKEQEFLTGVRWRHEMQACKAAGLCDLWIWIENPNVEVEPTCEIRASDCDATILNDSDEPSYHAKLRRFANFLNKSRSLLTQCQ